jgi:glyceraldehyde 3-phosphate dehydrogenase
MTPARLGLMGFGRIGRNVFRMVADHPDLEIAAIADVAEPNGLTYLLKYDSIYGRFRHPVDLQGSSLFLDGRKIPFLDARQPGEADWDALGVDIVVQATGGYRTADWCKKHLEAGASRVILASTPETPGDIPLMLRGVNDDLLTPEVPIISLGSNTSNALAPVLRILDRSFGIDRAFFTSVHAMTNSQRLADVPGSGFRQSRAAGENIIPGETNSAELLMQVMPELAGKLSASALNVPVADGSTVDLVTHLESPVTIEEVNAAVRSAATASFKGIIEYSTDPIVSSDVRMAPQSGVFDSLATMVIGGTMAKTITWYNNGWGYTARLIEVAEQMAANIEEGAAK